MRPTQRSRPGYPNDGLESGPAFGQGRRNQKRNRSRAKSRAKSRSRSKHVSPAASPLGRVTFSLFLQRKSNQKESRPRTRTGRRGRPVPCASRPGGGGPQLASLRHVGRLSPTRPAMLGSLYGEGRATARATASNAKAKAKAIAKAKAKAEAKAEAKGQRPKQRRVRCMLMSGHAIQRGPLARHVAVGRSGAYPRQSGAMAQKESPGTGRGFPVTRVTLSAGWRRCRAAACPGTPSTARPACPRACAGPR